MMCELHIKKYETGTLRKLKYNEYKIPTKELILTTVMPYMQYNKRDIIYAKIEIFILLVKTALIFKF